MAWLCRIEVAICLVVGFIISAHSICHPIRFENRVYLKCHDVLRLIPDNTTMTFLEIREEHIQHELKIGPNIDPISAANQGIDTLNSCVPMRFEGNMYIKCDKVIRAIPDKATFSLLGFNESFIAHEHDINIGAPIPTLDGQFVNYDHWLEIHVTKFSVLSGIRPLLYNFTSLGVCFNPSLVDWKEDYILFCRDAYKSYGGALQLGWVDRETRIQNKDKNLYGIGPGVHNVDTKFVFGEDFRVLKLNSSTFLLTYTGEWERWGMLSMCRIKYAYMTMDDSSQQVKFSAERRLIPAGSKNPYDIKTCEKNWVPFDYHGKTVFMIDIKSSKVISVERLTESENYTYWDRAVEFGGPAPANDIVWKYGPIRGGTPALRLNNRTNLGFFHSKDVLAPSNKVTYWMGAFLFLAEPPFSVVSISRVPIVHSSLYTGPWYNPMMNRFYDYVVYPMSFIYLNTSFNPLGECNRECLREQWLLLSIGTQDINGVTSRLNLLDLLDSLADVKHFV